MWKSLVEGSNREMNRSEREYHTNSEFYSKLYGLDYYIKRPYSCNSTKIGKFS